MKLPFFKTQKPEQKDTMSVYVPQRTAPPKTIPTHEPPAALTSPLGNDTTISVRLTSIASQLPRGLLATDDRSKLGPVKLAVPAGLVIPKLASGKVVLKVGDIVPLIPAELLNPAILPSVQTYEVVLPLAEVVAAIPAEALAIKHESEIKIEESDLETFFSSKSTSAAQPVPASVAPAEVVVPSPPAPAPAQPAQPPIPAPSVDATPPIGPSSMRSEEIQPMAVTPQPKPVADSTIPPGVNVPDYVTISLRGLVAGLPESLLLYQKTDIDKYAELSGSVSLPVKPLLPQLRSARVTVPVSEVIDKVPHQILVQPFPNLTGLMAVLPLRELIPQLPPELFLAQIATVKPEDLSGEIPTPFQERVSKPAPAPELVVPAALEPAVPAKPEITEAELEKEEVSIFVEKKPAPVVTPAPVEVPEPVVPTPPVPVAEPVEASVPAEPIAPVVPIEPVAPPPERVVPPEPLEPGVLDERKFLVDLNRCSVEDLMRIPGVGRTLAQRIIAFRNERGAFANIEELRLIPGVGRKTFRALTGASPHSLNKLLGVADDHELTLQEIVKLTGKLPGVDGTMLAMANGLFLAGQLPPELNQEAISVFAPQLFKRMSRYVKELQVGTVSRFTIFTEQRPISVFRAGDVYLVIVHDTRHFSKRLLRECERISQEIARLCRQRTVV